MKKTILVTTFFVGSLLCSSGAHAIPALQLDIAGGHYDDTTETVVSGGSVFTLYALLTPTGEGAKGDSASMLADTYYISVALTPMTSTAGDYGSFLFNGATVHVTGDMSYGVPPLGDSDLSHDAHDLSTHDIFETYFTEFSFTFSEANKTSPYNTADDSGLGGFDATGSGAYYATFTVDVSGLAEGYGIHFDLYNTEYAAEKKTSTPLDLDVGMNAPYSHDAESGPGTAVPEPATMLLFGTGIAGLAGIARRKRD